MRHGISAGLSVRLLGRQNLKDHQDERVGDRDDCSFVSQFGFEAFILPLKFRSVLSGGRPRAFD